MPVLKGKPPASISPLILRVLNRVRPPSEAGTIGQAVAELSHLYTKERQSLAPRYLDNPEHAAAYLNYFMPVNLSKIQVLLDELPVEDMEAERQAGLQVLDIGSGQGTGALAVLDWLYQRSPASALRLSVMAVDASRQALQQADGIWRQYCHEAGIAGPVLKVCEGNLERLAKASWRDRAKEQEPYDLILVANCLNELFGTTTDPIASRTQFIADLLPMLTPHGTLMLVEPALRSTSRALHQVRDRLLREKRCTVYSPCLHERGCPALIHPDDWCHEERPWDPPAHIETIDREVGFIKDALKFSYVLLRKDGRTIMARDPQTFRIVSELRVMKGDTRAWVCNELGRSEIGRLDRAKSGTNAAWDECRRGSIVKVEGLQRKEGSALARIPAEGHVDIKQEI
jgi:ribosomal protein RSM22 (predicted rRNA methylase)